MSLNQEKEQCSIVIEGSHQNLQQKRTQQQQQQQQQQRQRKKYGNMVVIYDGAMLVTLGPDFRCFIPTFILFCVIAWFVGSAVISATNNPYYILVTIFVCEGTCLSYLAIGISNPGIVTQDEIETLKIISLQESETISKDPLSQHTTTTTKSKICRRCNLTVKRTTFHCSDCNVCISQYDHHCPWTSKCIGGGNLKRFYLFLTMIPVFLFFCIIAFAAMVSAKSQSNLLPTI